MYALISPEEMQLGYEGEILGARVAQISDEPFPVAQPLYWVNIDVIPEGILYYLDEKILSMTVPPVITLKEIEL